LSTTFGSYGARHPVLGRLSGGAVRPLARSIFRLAGAEEARSDTGNRLAKDLRTRIARGQEAILLGVTPAGQNSGAGLVRVGPDGRIELICNEEEERYTGVKYCNEYPARAIAAVRERLAELRISPREVAGCFLGWNYAELTAQFARVTMEEFPGPLVAEAPDEMGPRHLLIAARAPRRIARQLGLRRPLPTVSVRHHDAHAYLAWALSPFAASEDRVLITVIDGYGDDASVSLYFTDGGGLRLMYRNDLMDSLGMYYGVMSSTQGGWPPLHSDGRYMGAAAWGNGSRTSNPYYRSLRELLHLGRDGEVRYNRALGNWHRGSLATPYGDELTALMGHPVPPDEFWNPDAVIDVENIKHAEITRERVDKAAAVQLVFEDAVLHIVDHGLRRSGAAALIMTGGTALNCVANSKVIDTFDESWFERYAGRADTRLRVWVPPVQGDTGIPAGAAFAFALKHGGARPGKWMRHAFYCGQPPSAAAIAAAIDADPQIAAMRVGNVESDLATIADLAAFVVADDGVIGLYQGAAETGPRALGHRSILANPCSPATRDTINAKVKRREWIRPLAPMATRDAAERLFALSPGAADDDYNAYNYMVLTAPARPEAHDLVPAVIHKDGTARLQIVREETDRLSHAFLTAMGRHAGVEVSVNTSLNVGSAIAHTPEQAVETLRRAKGMDGLLMIGDDGEATLVWHQQRRPPEAKARLARWLERNGDGRERLAEAEATGSR
jgi:carbamoyltransferase